MPILYRQVGLEMVDTAATVMVGGPGSPVWDWLSAYFLGVLDRYGAIRPLTKAAALRLRRAWRAAARQPTSLMIAPAVLSVVGRRRAPASRAPGHFIA